MRKKIIILLVTLLLFSCSRYPPSKFAIVYGISDYAYPTIKLPYSANDGKSVAALLESYGYSVILRVDTSATKENLVKDIERVSRAIGSNDLFFFYFSGHGIDRQTMVDLGEAGYPADYFSMLFHHRFTYRNLAEYVKANSVSKSELADLFGSIPTGVKVSVLDACYSGLAANKNAVADFTPDNYAGEALRVPKTVDIIREAAHVYANTFLNGHKPLSGYVALSSSGGGEISWDGFFEHSVFTYFFLLAAEQGDIDNDGAVTMLEAHAFVTAALQKYWNSDSGDSEWNFLPHISGDACDPVIFDRRILLSDAIISPE
jgi:hypothetical protein